jgi:threonylcarbamoyladenosine tRNA methylthiotransferase MtaB
MRVYLETLGCRLNYAEMAALGRQLTAAGHELAQSASEADLCVLNSCAVTGEAARQSRQLARQIARAKPTSKLIVTGCYATLEGETVGRLPNVTLVVGNSRKDEILSVIKEQAARVQDGEDAEEAVLPSHHPLIPANGQSRTRAFIKVQDGCRNKCTFCIVTVARGEEHSRSIADILAEVRSLHDEGYQEAVLTGVHLGGYGAELDTSLIELTTVVLAATQIPRLRLSSLEPFDLQPDFFDLWRRSDGRLMPHLHLPAQSGSDAVLKRMARRNRVGDFERLVDSARAAIPGLTITTDLIVGFPGETESDFEATLAFAQRVGFAHMHVFPYSARQGTAAAWFSGQVVEAERKRRVHELTDLDARLGHAVRASFTGQVRPVLWENGVGRDAGTPGSVVTWAGLTDNYLRVRAPVAAGIDLHNRIIATRLVGLDGDDLIGEIDLGNRSNN